MLPGLLYLIQYDYPANPHQCYLFSVPISCSVLYRPLVGNTETPVSVPGRLGGPPLGGFYPNSIRISCIFLRTASMNVLRPILPSINFDILLSAISLLLRQYGDPDFSLRTTRGEPPPGGFYHPNSIRISYIFHRMASTNVLRPMPLSSTSISCSWH